MNDLIKQEETIKDKTSSLVDDIINEDDIDKTKQLLNLFNINIAKKNTVRVAKVDELLDKANDEAIKRLSERPDNINDKDLISYINVAQNQIGNALDNIRSVNEVPTIQFNDNSVNVNVTEKELSRESRERVLQAVQQILDNANSQDVIDVEVKNK